MLTAKQFGSLKKVSVGVNQDKSNARIPEAFKSASTGQKSEIVKLSGLSKFVFYKASTSPKAILSLACVLGISPFYLSGESDDKKCDDNLIKEFYKKCVTDSKKKTVKKKPVKAAKPGRKPVAKKAVEKAAATSLKPKSAAKKPPVKPAKEASRKKSAPTTTVKKYKIDEELLVALLKSLSIRAKFGGEAEKTYNAVVELLIK